MTMPPTTPPPTAPAVTARVTPAVRPTVTPEVAPPPAATAPVTVLRRIALRGAPYLVALVTVVTLAALLSHGARSLADRWPAPARLATGDAPLQTPPPVTSRADARSRPAAAGTATGTGTGAITGTGTGSASTSANTSRPGVSAGEMSAASGELLARHLTLPVANVRPEQLSSTFSQARGERPHEALDIMAPRGTPVVAVEDGRLVKLFWSNAGGHTIYQFDPSERFAYYYAHLDRYADGLTEGRWITRGQVIGYVGSTGNARADAPHLHFAIFVLTPAKRWWEGTAVDPYPILRWVLDPATS